MPESVHASAAARYLRKLSRGVAGASTGAVEAATMEALSSHRAEEALEQAVRTIEREAGAALDPASRGELERLFCEDGKRAIERLKSKGVSAQLAPREEPITNSPFYARGPLAVHPRRAVAAGLE